MAAEEGPARARILIVDDDKDVLELLSHFLGEEYDVTTTTDPFDAVERTKGTDFDLVMVDQNMPKLKGIDTARKILAYAYVKIVLCSGDLTNEEEEQAAKYHIKTMGKPNSLHTLRQNIKDLIGT